MITFMLLFSLHYKICSYFLMVCIFHLQYICGFQQLGCSGAYYCPTLVYYRPKYHAAIFIHPYLSSLGWAVVLLTILGRWPFHFLSSLENKKRPLRSILCFQSLIIFSLIICTPLTLDEPISGLGDFLLYWQLIFYKYSPITANTLIIYCSR